MSELDPLCILQREVLCKAQAIIELELEAEKQKSVETLMSEIQVKLLTIEDPIIREIMKCRVQDVLQRDCPCEE